MSGGGADGSPPLKEIDNASRDVIFDVVDAVLHDYTKSPSQQFDLVYTALCLPAAQQFTHVRFPLMTLLEAITPGPLFQFFSSVNLFIPGYDEESIMKRNALINLARALMGECSTEGFSELPVSCEDFPELSQFRAARKPAEISEEEYILVLLDDFKRVFPTEIRVPAFESIESNATEISLRSRFYTLLGRLCIELDPEKSGKVKLEDLKEMAIRVLGKDRAELLLKDAPVDEEGKLRYAQLCALLSRPPHPSSKIEP